MLRVALSADEMSDSVGRLKELARKQAHIADCARVGRKPETVPPDARRDFQNGEMVLRAKIDMVRRPNINIA